MGWVNRKNELIRILYSNVILYFFFVLIRTYTRLLKILRPFCSEVIALVWSFSRSIQTQIKSAETTHVLYSFTVINAICYYYGVFHIHTIWDRQRHYVPRKTRNASSFRVAYIFFISIETGVVSVTFERTRNRRSSSSATTPGGQMNLWPRTGILIWPLFSRQKLFVGVRWEVVKAWNLLFLSTTGYPAGGCPAGCGCVGIFIFGNVRLFVRGLSSREIECFSLLVSAIVVAGFLWCDFRVELKTWNVLVSIRIW